MSKFIVFEGGEGVGKSTQLKFFDEYLKKTGQKAVFTREPGGTPLAEKIRKLILEEEMNAESEALLFAAARADHIDNFILPNLRDGNIVVCDRFVDSSIVYQGFARDLGEDKVRFYNDYAMKNCLPDAVVFLDMNPLESWRRKKGTVIENDRLEREKDEFHLAVYNAYSSLAKKDDRFISIIPCEDKEQTAKKIVEALRDRGIIR